MIDPVHGGLGRARADFGIDSHQAQEVGQHVDGMLHGVRIRFPAGWRQEREGQSLLQRPLHRAPLAGLAPAPAVAAPAPLASAAAFAAALTAALAPAPFAAPPGPARLFVMAVIVDLHERSRLRLALLRAPTRPERGDPHPRLRGADPQDPRPPFAEDGYGHLGSGEAEIAQGALDGVINRLAGHFNGGASWGCHASFDPLSSAGGRRRRRRRRRRGGAAAVAESGASLAPAPISAGSGCIVCAAALVSRMRGRMGWRLKSSRQWKFSGPL